MKWEDSEQLLSNGIDPAEYFYKEPRAMDTWNVEGSALFIRLLCF